MTDELSKAFVELSKPMPELDGYILGECAPVPYFGDIESSRVATLGLNPSDNEFYNKYGEELQGIERRFHTLKSMGLASWGDAKLEHFNKIKKSCDNYFEINPYRSWFDVLDNLFIETGYSYYRNVFGNPMCHLDLVPYATEEKWGRLKVHNKSVLLREGGNCLYEMLNAVDIDLIVLNGRSVINELEKISNVNFDVVGVPDWDLKRGNGKDVRGLSYRGAFDCINGKFLKRTISVLGFNHNLQSSFGVTNKVKREISIWIKGIFDEEGR